MNRRTFLKLGAAIGAGVALPLSMGSSTKPSGCEADNSQTNGRNRRAGQRRARTDQEHKYNDGRPRQPVPDQRPHHDDGERYRCTHPSHKVPYIIFGSAGVAKHLRSKPSHRGYIVRY